MPSHPLACSIMLLFAAGLAGCGAAPVRDAAAALPATASNPVASGSPATPAAAFGDWGVDLSGKDTSVRPGNDFFRYAGGNWLAGTQLPSDRARWGVFDQLAARAEADVRVILDELRARQHAPGSAEQKAGEFYGAFLDTAAIETRGLAPAQPGLAAIAAAKTHADVAALFGRVDLALNAPIAVGITLDAKDPDRYVATIGHAGLGLPEREFYRRTDEQFAKTREEYRAHLARALAFAGDPDPAEGAAAILALETAIAERHWPIAQRREREKTYNLRTRAELDALAPGFPWGPLLVANGLDGPRDFVVRELDAMAPLARLFRETPVASWRRYMAYHYLRAHASVLPKAVDDEFFAFYGRTLNGQPEQRERWKRAVQATDGAVGEAVGQVYVARHFPPESKAQMLALVENVRRAYAQRIAALEWMTPETRAVAKEKLATFRPKIGYPDRWLDYSKLEVRRDDAFGNAVRARVFDWQRELERIDRKTDRDEWFMTPQNVNAYYNPIFNEIVFPAAILQPPFFDPKADPAVNYGAIGGVIGHEMGHGFDDQGAKSDARGILRNWWNERDVAAFTALGDRLAAQYDRFEPLPGLRINGRLSLGENIGDLGGLSVAHGAYRLSLAGSPAPVRDGLSGDQRFFLAWAQVWRVLYREQALRNQVMTGPHSPGEFRVNGVVRNIDAWYQAFDVQPDDALYLPAAERVRIW
jgi:putative endopeptidase